MKIILRIFICCMLLFSSLACATSEHCDTGGKSSCNLPPRVLSSLESCEGQTLTLQQGEICGILLQPADPLLSNGRPYLAYQGIPFAQPPTDTLRFMDPVAAGPWEGIRDGSWSHPVCPQLSIQSFFGGEVEVSGNEDCLYLNVFQPSKESHNLPVMVFIHGGGFMLGGIGEIGAEKFMTQDIILVTIQYRLGFLGFLSTEDSVVSGNQALKDQEMALRWVKDNIAVFGGDKDRVTIFGESAGAISVHLQMLNPRAAGLFSRAILQSGTAFLSNSLPVDHRSIAKQLSVKLNCTSADDVVKYDSDAILSCVQSASPKNLVLLHLSFIEWNFSPPVIGPRIDGEVIPEHPVQMLRDGKYHKVDIIAGTNKDEGLMVTAGLYGNPTLLDDIATRFSEIGKHVFIANTHNVDIAEKILKYYMGSIRRYTEKDFKSLTEMFGHYYFHIYNDISVELHARDTLYGHQVFAYELHYRGSWSFMEELFPELYKGMVNHADELQYMFSPTSQEMLLRYHTPSQNDRKLSEIILKLWSNFAAVGNPTPDRSLGFTWPSVTIKQQPHLVLELQPFMESDTRCEARNFYETLDMPRVGSDILFPGEIAKGVDWRPWRVKENNLKC